MQLAVMYVSPEENEMDKEKLIEKRLNLGRSIAHFRLMILRDYHPEFFKGLLVAHQIEQSKVLHQERNLLE